MVSSADLSLLFIVYLDVHELTLISSPTAQTETVHIDRPVRRAVGVPS